MSREHHILANPAADLDLPRQPKRLPRSVPSVQEVEAILAQADPEHGAGSARPGAAGDCFTPRGCGAWSWRVRRSTTRI